MTRRGRLVVTVSLLAVGTGAHPPRIRAQHVDALDSLHARAGLPMLPFRARDVGFADRGWAARADRAAADGVAVSGVLTVLLVPALFADSDAPPGGEAELQRLFFDGPSPSGTLREFFTEASAGLLDAVGAAAPWFRTSVTREAGTGGAGSVFGTGPAFGTYLLEAIAAADRAMDFGRFDNDGPDGIPNSGDDNGVVDAVTFLFAEVGRSCGGPGVWPHKSGLSGRNGGVPFASADTAPDGSPIEVDGYVIISASECDGSPLSTVAIVAHELGHELRLPDIYHPIGSGLEAILPTNRRWVLGCFGLMAAGAWGCGAANLFPSFGPTHFSPWSRRQLGWIDLREVGSDVRYETVTLAPVQASQQVLQIPLDTTGTESLLVEYRPRVGFDDELPASGVVIHRLNEAGAFRPDPAMPWRYRVTLLEADADSTLLRNHAEGGNRGEASDVFVIESGRVAISNVTLPASTLADGAPSSVTIHGMELVDGQVHLIVSTADAPGVVTGEEPIALQPLVPADLDLPVGGGAQPYATRVLFGSLPDGLVLDVSLDRLRISGAPFATGHFDIIVRIEDARGRAAVSVVPMLIDAPVIGDSALVAGLLGPAGRGLTDAQRQLLDNDGNRNGTFDVGDLRAYLLRPSP